MWGKKSHCEKVIESEKAIAAKTAARDEAESSRSHNHVPVIASRSFAEPAARNAERSGSGRVSSVKGENAADWPLAASGVPAPFQRSRSGSEPSAQASLTACAQGSICMTTSLRYGFARQGSVGREPGLRRRDVLERQHGPAREKGAGKRRERQKEEERERPGGNRAPERSGRHPGASRHGREHEEHRQ